MLIGLCGKSGSGKSTIAQMLSEKSGEFIHCNIDEIGHKTLLKEEVKKELIKAFGEQIICDKFIDRKKLGDLVFENREKMETLSIITWKYMKEEIDNIIEINKNKTVILDWILLYQSEYFDKCAIKVLVDTPYEIRKDRAIKRDNITEEKFNLREKASIEYERSKFDYVVDGTELSELEGLVKRLEKSIVSR